MKKVGSFEKVSFEQFRKDMINTFGEKSPIVWHLADVYDEIQIPRRKTQFSAGYDFTSPITFTLMPGTSKIIPTGIKVNIDEGWVLKCYPRSGLGFKYMARLANGTGVIDGDYVFSDNEGHIFIKLTNESNEGKVLEVEVGNGIAQGIFVEYGITYDDEVDGVRNGGFGSTDKQNISL